MDRTATIERKTRETDITFSLNLDGTGKSDVNSGIPFLDHMLTLMSAHGFMDLNIKATGDTHIDDHHTIEDLGICFGKAIRQALGDKKGVVRYGRAVIPMDEAMVRVVIDLSNRPFLAYRVAPNESKTGNFDINLMKEFFRALVNEAGMTMHVDLVSGENAHHISEAIFKAFGRALDQAVQIDSRLGDAVPSTKGLL